MEHDEKVTLSDKINNFFEQNRKKVAHCFCRNIYSCDCCGCVFYDF